MSVLPQLGSMLRSMTHAADQEYPESELPPVARLLLDGCAAYEAMLI